jgi:RimJ/RimL family protein N-acetyltransferase
VNLRRAVPDDIGFMMATERLPGYEWLVGRWEADKHRAVMADGGNAVLVGLDAASAPCGFAIMRHNDDTEQNFYLQRIALAAPGGGLGTALLKALLDWVFSETDTHRFWLLVKDGNDRAIRAYQKSGFSTEGRLRETFVTPSGERGDAFVMSILRTEWPIAAASGTN